MNDNDTEKNHAKFAARLHESMEELWIAPHRRASTIARWFDQDTKNPQFAYSWLKGDKLPRRDRLPILAAKLNVEQEWLENGNGPKRISAEMKEIIHLIAKVKNDKQKLARIGKMIKAGLPELDD